MASAIFITSSEGEVVNVDGDYYDHRARDIIVINPVYHIHCHQCMLTRHNPRPSNSEATHAVERPSARESTLVSPENVPFSPAVNEVEHEFALAGSSALDGRQRGVRGQHTCGMHQFNLEQDEPPLNPSTTPPTSHHHASTPPVVRASYPPLPRSSSQARAVLQNAVLESEEGYIVLQEDDGTGHEVCALPPKIRSAIWL
ncbi:hypothetical protein HWV62_29749 [Athelia sp. TMB]|nr:hypothetical protein HWV62_29749 [Athelia sp. TMB]